MGRLRRPQAGTQFPFYLRWYFRTGTHGDFEYLVRLLSPQPVDPRVGNRDMDVLSPGANLPGITNLGGILRLGGALQVPDTDLDAAQLAQRQGFENWDQPFPHPFERALAAFVDLPDDYAAQAAADANSASGLGAGVEDDPDPLITAPLYGQWHALTQRLLTNRDGTPAPNPQNWVHRLNLDPRFRVPAGFGADVVRGQPGGVRRRRLAADRRRPGREQPHPLPAPGHRGQPRAGSPPRYSRWQPRSRSARSPSPRRCTRASSAARRRSPRSGGRAWSRPC